jgi:hypothetical protein
MILRIYKHKKTKRTVTQQKDPVLDLEMQIIAELEELKGRGNTVRLYFIRGHQELRKSKFDMDHNGQMRIKADELTKKARKNPPLQCYHKFPANTVELAIPDNSVTGHFPQQTTESYHNINLTSYLSEKHNWSNKVMEEVWWRVHQKALNSYNVTQDRSVVEFGT